MRFAISVIRRRRKKERKEGRNIRSEHVITMPNEHWNIGAGNKARVAKAKGRGANVSRWRDNDRWKTWQDSFPGYFFPGVNFPPRVVIRDEWIETYFPKIFHEQLATESVPPFQASLLSNNSTRVLHAGENTPCVKFGRHLIEDNGRGLLLFRGLWTCYED